METGDEPAPTRNSAQGQQRDERADDVLRSK